MSPKAFRSSTLALLLGTGFVAAPAQRCAAGDGGPDTSKLNFFESKVRPLLVDNCYTCHSANTNAKGGLRVDDRGGLLTGGDNGPAVVPGNPEKSLLIKAVAYHDKDLQMPPKKQLTEQQLADLTKWVADGAAWPAVEVASAPRTNEKYERLKRQHWAWQPIHDSAAPKVHDESWPRTDVDRFVLATLEERNLKPVADADRVSLIRRVTFDLAGLPPTPQHIDAFVADTSADAFTKIIDRLLASPAYGERWGRHWLDVARYAESTGSSRNVPYPHAWRYRDYVIDAFNADKPFDAFVREQVAGDLLAASPPAEHDAAVVATGFLALGVKDVNQRFKVRFVMDNVDEQIDTVTRSVLATTAACARCHDHKFDPVSQADYYALAGIFRSTDLCAGGPEARNFAQLASASDRRSVYLPLLRGLVPTSLEVFDFAEQGMVTGSRDATTVATQALYLLNDPFVRKQALSLAKRALNAPGDDESRVTLAYRLTLGRDPTESEKSRVLAFVADYESAAKQVIPENSKPADKPAEVATNDTDAGANAGNGGGDAKPKPPVNPDEVVADDAPVKEETVQPDSPRQAAWASFCAALLGSTEFRYLK